MRAGASLRAMAKQTLSTERSLAAVKRVRLLRGLFP